MTLPQGMASCYGFNVQGLHKYRSRCHGNVRLKDDSKSQRSIPIALHMIINSIHVHCGQSAREVYNDVITAILYLL